MDATTSSLSQGTLQSSGEGSSKSSGTASKSSGSKKEHERDLSKDNVASPIDLECHIQQERITKILDEAIYMTKLAICLPKMVQNYRVLSSRLTPQHMDDLIFIFEQYDNPLFSASLLNMAAMDDIKAGDVSLRNRLNPELGHLLHILHSYPSLGEHVDELVQQLKDEYLKSDDDSKQPSPALEYLLGFERFREIMVAQMQTTAAEELGEKIRIRKLEISNAKLIAQIKELMETIRKEQEEFEKMMSVKADEIAALEKELAALNEASKAKLKKKVLDSDRKMVLMSRAHAVKNELLKDEEIYTREGYNSLLHQHLVEEKAHRARRFKVETQLLSWLQKYDVEMTDKQKEHDELEKKYNEELKRVEELTKKIEEQELEYLPLMQEKEDEYHAEMTQKMQMFLLEHSARVIQNAWRQVLINRNEKRKLRALWKKTKKERDRRQRIMDAREVKARKEAAKTAKLQKQAAKDALAAREVPD
ncbi:IQ domain-containing protein D-like [Phthorimaea operculella]|nr:IQ domain-containing protein D-like [Phthorimaea operculella]